MFNVHILLLIGFFITGFGSVDGLWSCSSDQECSNLSGSVCDGGACVCPVGTQAVSGGALCAPVAPYHTSPCVEDHQCQRLFTGFQCRTETGAPSGTCRCQPGHHFFKGRCWASKSYGETCSRNEECFGVIRDPNSLACDNGVCTCAEGFFERQRGECRRAGFVVGDGCVLDQDCLFLGGACDVSTFTCYDSAAGSALKVETLEDTVIKTAAAEIKMATTQHGAACGVGNPCDSPLVCSAFGVCVCPIGYYANDNNTLCLAELESPAHEAQCTGLFASVVDGVCTCPPNFFFEESMRDCVKVARFISDACVMDESCHTFGAAARCGPAVPPWGLRACQCVPELAVWDRDRNMCRLFAGIGEACQVDSDCLAGELEIQCQLDEQGNGFCACPDGLAEFEGLCIAAGLELGEACQVSEECTGAENAVCAAGRCSCDDGYQQVDHFCAPVIGGRCATDADCVIEHTVCANDSDSDALTCQCAAGFVHHSDVCWRAASGHEAACNVTAQCSPTLGDAGQCAGGLCVCAADHHYRDQRCWRKTGLFESCTRQSQCFLGDLSERVVCRNSLCQCDFRYPYSEQLNTCTSSASINTVSVVVFMASTALFYL